MPVSLSVCQSVRGPTGRIYVKIDIGDLLNSVEKFQFRLNSGEEWGAVFE